MIHCLWCNRYLSRLVGQGRNELRIDLEDWEGNKRYAKYDTFTIGDWLDNYRLTIGGYSGDAGDAMAYANGMEFSTLDRDNDERSYQHCADYFKGAWWHKECHYANLNGLYLKGNHSGRNYAMGVCWNQWLGFFYSLKRTEMKIRLTC